MDSDLKVIKTHRGTILYAEDNPDNLRLVEEFLSIQGSGISLVSTTRGENVLDLVLKHQPDLLLLNLHLPDMNGKTVVEKLRSDKRIGSLPIAILSSEAQPKTKEKLFESGANYYMTKPLDVRMLATIIKSHTAKILPEGVQKN